MRVLLVTPSYFPIVGGSEVLAQTLSAKLNEAGTHADIMTFNMDEKWKPVWMEDRVQDGSFKVFRQPAFNPLPNLHNPIYNLFGVYVVPKLSFVKRFMDYDVIHFVGEADLSLEIFSIHVKKPKLLQFVGMFRGGGMYWYCMVYHPHVGMMVKRLVRKLADVFIVSSGEEKDLLLDMGLPEEKISIVRVGVDTETFHPDESMKAENLLLFVGRITRIKGLHILMNALQYINAPSRIAIVGPKWDASYTAEIKQKAAETNKKGLHKVSFLGSLGQKELAKWYQKASIVVCPYVYETSSNVVREALACGTPVVSTGSHIDKGEDGILVTSKNERDLADGINRLLEDEKLREKYGREGRQLIERCFSWGSVIRELTDLYVDVLSTWRP